MKFFYVAFNGEMVVAANDEYEAGDIAMRTMAKMQPGPMNVCVGASDKPNNRHLVGVSCKTIYPDGSVSDCVPFPQEVSLGTQQ